MKIVVDTREKQGIWNFEEEVIVRKLRTGDYTIDGLEDFLCIERKKSVSEFSINTCEARFKDVLERMQQYRYRFIIFEFSMNDVLRFPIGSGIPKNRWDKLKLTSQFLMKRISEIQVNYEIDVIFAGDGSNAKYIAHNIMKRVYEKHSDN